MVVIILLAIIACCLLFGRENTKGCLLYGVMIILFLGVVGSIMGSCQ